MFSRLLHTAKSYIAPTPHTNPIAAVDKFKAASKDKQFTPRTSSVKKSPSPTKAQEISATKPAPRRKTRIHSPDMVTTRQDASAQKKKQEVEEELTDENSINVYIPSTSSAKSKGKKRGITSDDVVETPSRSAKKRKVVTPKKNEDVLMKSSRLVVEIPVTKELRDITEKAGDVTIEDSPTEESLEEDAAEHEDIAEEKKVAGNSVQKIAEKSAEKPKLHKKFDSDDEGDEEEIFSTARSARFEEKVEEESDDDDDEAPEEVGAQSAALTAKAQDESAKLAILSLKSKRKERISKLQQKPKKKIPTEVEKILAEALSEESEASSSEDESDDEEGTTALSRAKRITFDQPPKDRKVGTTTYRVSEPAVKNLPPKAGKVAKNMKESWLKGRNGKLGIGATRKPVKKGFF